MALNPNIILQGQGVDVVGQMGRGNALAQQTIGMNQDRERNALYREHGAGIAAGDQASINALAAIDPGAAQGAMGNVLSMDNTRLGMQATQQRMDMLSREEQRAIDQQAAQMTAAERAAEAQQIEQAVAAGLQVQTPQQWDAMMAQTAPDLVGQFDNREAIAGRFMSVADSLKRFDEQNAVPDAASPSSTIGKLQSDLASGLIDQQQYDLAVANMAPPGMKVESDGQGGFTFVTGAGVGVGDGKTPNERQSSLALFGNLMDETMPELSNLEASPDFNPASLSEGIASNSGWLGNYMRTPEGRRYEALQRQWAEGVLRIQTGAAATQSEIDRVMATYFPQPGDTDADIAGKSQQRDAFARSLEPASGGNITAPGGAGDRPGIGEAVAESEVVTAQAIPAMSDAQLQEYLGATSLEDIPDDVLEALEVRMAN